MFYIDSKQTMFDYVRSYTLLCLDILTKSIHISYRSVIKEFRAGFAIIVLLLMHHLIWKYGLRYLEN